MGPENKLHAVLQKNAGKQPAEIVNALLLAGFAVVPVEYPVGADYVRAGAGRRWWGQVIEFARVKL